MTLAKGAPLDLESINDATFNRDPANDVYGIMLSYAGGAVLHKTKLFRCAVGSAHEGEAIPTVMGSAFLAVGREALRSMGDPQDQPSFLGTDNFANALIASNEGNATRSRHFLRRYYVLLQRVKAGDNVIGHVPDTENPSDFLTKWGLQGQAAAVAALPHQRRRYQGRRAPPCHPARGVRPHGRLRRQGRGLTTLLPTIRLQHRTRAGARNAMGGVPRDGTRGRI